MTAFTLTRVPEWPDSSIRALPLNGLNGQICPFNAREQPHNGAGSGQRVTFSKSQFLPTVALNKFACSSHAIAQSRGQRHERSTRRKRPSPLPAV